MPWRENPIDDDRIGPRHALELDLLPDLYAICRLPMAADSSWARGELCAVIKSRREVQGQTVICDESAVPLEKVEANRGWRAIRFIGAFDFGELGVLGSVLNPLARAHVPVLTLSTFETDYVLFKAERLNRVRHALEEAGHRFKTEG